MKTALFHNFSDKEFKCKWDGKEYTFKAGQQRYMPAYLAEHFAKHLANAILLDKKMPEACSPKNPEQVPAFYELFTKACIIPDGDDTQKEADLEMDLIEKEMAKAKIDGAKTTGDRRGKDPQIVPLPKEDEEEFEGLKDPSSNVEAPKNN